MMAINIWKKHYKYHASRFELQMFYNVNQIIIVYLST